MLVGTLLVLGCVTGGVLVAARLGDRESVLELARPVSAGQRLEARDLREVSLSTDSGLEAVSARSLDAVRGRVMAYSLPAGALLTERVLGSPKTPPRGQANAAVGLRAGQFPTGLQPGLRVNVVEVPDPDAAGGRSAGEDTGERASWSATVVDVRPAQEDQLTVLTLLLGERDARQLAAVPDGAVRILAVHGGGGR
ncbi:SAF domain-containing protein [Streptomyces sp. NPDC059009]|uniref:SAF domain-containing protein n=1 Tax=Streptomyces sp. NPDC059009 TaxID=3346694 RepID=UPI0036CDB3C6